MTISPDTHVSELATAHTATVRVFQAHGIDFCCGGRRPLRVASDQHEVELEDLLAELEAAVAAERPGEICDWRERSLTELVAHIVAAYHEPQKKELPRLAALMARVLSAHGDRRPRMLHPLAGELALLAREADEHTANEEAHVFPAIVALEGGARVDPAIFSAMRQHLEREHASMGRVLAEIRRLTTDFTPPEDACPTFRALFDGLRELTAALHNHVHLENHILFPRAAALAAAMLAPADGR